VLPGVIARQNIPQAYKVALQDIPQDEAVIRYGVILGYEVNLIRGLMYSNNDFSAFLKAPISGAFLIFTTGMVIWTGYQQVKRVSVKKAAQ